MKFGIADDKVFDPESSIDLSKSTVVVNIWYTNFTMKNFTASDWPSIPVTIAAVPLHHSFFRVNLTLGEKVRGLKLQKSTAKKEEMCFHTLDRWDLPMVPWRANAFRASLCQGPDHGIAMKLGIIDNEIFDSETGIDLTKSTVVLDTWCTNHTMRNYFVCDWPSIPATLAAIPLHHSFFRVDLALGDKV